MPTKQAILPNRRSQDLTVSHTVHNGPGFTKFQFHQRRRSPPGVSLLAVFTLLGGVYTFTLECTNF